MLHNENHQTLAALASNYDIRPCHVYTITLLLFTKYMSYMTTWVGVLPARKKPVETSYWRGHQCGLTVLWPAASQGQSMGSFNLISDRFMVSKKCCSVPSIARGEVFLNHPGTTSILSLLRRLWPSGCWVSAWSWTWPKWIDLDLGWIWGDIQEPERRTP